MNRVRLTKLARNDLDSIHTYIAVERQSPENADRLIEFLVDKLDFLGKNPLMGELREDLRPGLRCFAAGNYVICYRPKKIGISVTRVLHGWREWKKLL